MSADARMQGQFSYQLQDAFDIYVKYAFNNLIQQGNTVCVQCEHKCNSRWWIKSANVKGIAKSSGRKGNKGKKETWKWAQNGDANNSKFCSPANCVC